MNTHHRPTPRPRGHAALAATACAALLGACSSTSPTVPGPMVATALQTPLYLERPSNGAIFQPGMNANSLFSPERRPSAVGDTMKVDIAETLKASQKQTTDTSRSSQLASKGPGGSSKVGFIDRLLNLNASASGADSFKGSGTTSTENSFATQIAVTVINVMPNGNLLVAGERSIGLNQGVNTIRFSGIVNPRSIQPGNVVPSGEVVNASLESVAQGDVSDASSRTWLQRVLARTLSVW